MTHEGLSLRPTPDEAYSGTEKQAANPFAQQELLDARRHLLTTLARCAGIQKTVDGQEEGIIPIDSTQEALDSGIFI